MSLSRFWNLEFNAPFLKRFARECLVSDGKARIRFGPLKGFRVHAYDDVNVHLILGAWELRNFRFLKKTLPLLFPDKSPRICLDIGANLGAYSFWLTRQADMFSQFFAFEPAPEIAKRLRDNLELSNAHNVRIIEAACTDFDGKVDLFIGHHHHQSSLNREWAQGDGAPEGDTKAQVDAITIDSLAKDFSDPVAFIKIDIEGGGTTAIPGMRETVRKDRPVVFVESHSPAEDSAISQMICENDYCALRADTDSWVADPSQVHPSREGIWGTTLCLPREKSRVLTSLYGEAPSSPA